MLLLVLGVITVCGGSWGYLMAKLIPEEHMAIRIILSAIGGYMIGVSAVLLSRALGLL